MIVIFQSQSLPSKVLAMVATSLAVRLQPPQVSDMVEPRFCGFWSYMKIDKITAPAAIVHGTAGEFVPCSNGRALHAKLQRPFEPLGKTPFETLKNEGLR